MLSFATKSLAKIDDFKKPNDFVLTGSIFQMLLEARNPDLRANSTGGSRWVLRRDSRVRSAIIQPNIWEIVHSAHRVGKYVQEYLQK